MKQFTIYLYYISSSWFGSRILICSNLFLSLFLLTKICLQELETCSRYPSLWEFIVRIRIASADPQQKLSEEGRGDDQSSCKRRTTLGTHLPHKYSHSSTSSSYSTLYSFPSYFSLWFIFILDFFLLPFLCVFLLLHYLSTAFAAFGHLEDLIKSVIPLKNQGSVWPWLFGSGSIPDLIICGQGCGIVWEQASLPTHKESLRRGM